MFFDPRRYDLAKVGRYKFNKKLMLKNRITGHTLAEDVVSPMTGEVIAEAGAVVDRELADADPECSCSVCVDRKRRK